MKVSQILTPKDNLLSKRTEKWPLPYKELGKKVVQENLFMERSYCLFF